MWRSLVVAALALVLLSVPLATANHLSVGASEAVAVEPEETPDDPSVVGPAPDRETPYEVGTSSQCTEADESNFSRGQFERARASDAFCRELLYHPEDQDLRQPSAPDQVLHGPISTWDVVRVAHHGNRGLLASTCMPYCPSDPGGQTLFRAVHTVGSTAGLTDGPDEATSKGGQHTQTYGSGLVYPAASAVVDQEADVWRMNGWANPHLQERFVGFLLDQDGEPIGPDRLADIVQDNRHRFAETRTVAPSVCGFTPDAQMGAESGICEIDFTWRSDGASTTDGSNFTEGYRDPCGSPTYVCGATGPYWEALVTCDYGAGILLTEPCTDNGGPHDLEYTRLHWIVAPTQSACSGSQQPGAAFDTPGTAQINFLAHDLDVYVPPTSVGGVDGTEGMENVQDYTRAQADPDVILDQLPSLPGFPDIPSTSSTLSHVNKPNRVEPNAKTGNFTNLEESSQSIQVEREFEGGLCAPFTGSWETPHTLDPWVNYVDSEVAATNDVGVSVTIETNADDLAASASKLALYANQDPHQDDSNRPGPNLFHTAGQVGMFADMGDDGAYQQARNDDQFSEINDMGAYPLFYDMRVEPDNPTQPDTDAGCSLGSVQTTLVQNMVNAGYGPRTGLVQAVYLSEPSAIVDPDTGNTVPLPEGQTIVLFESQAIHLLREAEDPTVAGFVDRLVEGLRSHPSIPDDAALVSGNDVMGTDDAYGGQCQADTGGFDLELSFTHECQTGCAGDTIVTGYLAQLTNTENTVGAANGAVPFFTGGQDEPYRFPEDIVTWIDVDPFDNDPDRQREESHRPPHHAPDEDPEPRHHQGVDES